MHAPYTDATRAAEGGAGGIPKARTGPDPGINSVRPYEDWPNGLCSGMVNAAGLRWHVQRAGNGPVVLLIHGTGAATHSWRGLFPLLARNYDVIAPDLPGFGYSSPMRQPMSIRALARSLTALLQELDARPEIVAGHSSGAGLLLRMALDGAIRPRLIFGINAALMPYGGWLAPAFKPMARMLAGLPAMASLVASRAAKPGSVERAISRTGSQLSAQGIADYRNVLTRPGHVEATLNMMANWDHDSLLRDIHRLDVPLYLLTGSNDLAVPPRQAQQIAQRVAGARVVPLAGLGHLAHEESPELVIGVIRAAATEENTK